jgi:hypothetical protein
MTKSFKLLEEVELCENDRLKRLLILFWVAAVEVPSLSVLLLIEMTAPEKSVLLPEL